MPAVSRSLSVRLDPWMRGEEGPDPVSLEAGALAMDDPDLAESRLLGCLEVGVDDVRNIAGSEGVQVEFVLDRNLDRVRRFV